MLGLAGEWLKWTDGARDYWHVAANNMEFPEYWKGPAFPPSFGITPPGRAVVEKGNAIQHHHPELGDVTDYPLSCWEKRAGPFLPAYGRQPCHGQFPRI